MRIIFLGTPDFAVPSLNALCDTNHEIIAVVSQPDRKGNRNKISPTPVKVCAMAHGLEVLQYDRISRDGVEYLKTLKADIMITCAFGQILSDDILNMTKYGVINVHASILPKYRGSSPIQWCVINGEKYTGVTIMQTAKSIDSGDIISQTQVEIGEDETSGELFDRLSIIGASALVKTLASIESGNYDKIGQDHSLATHCSMLKKEDGKIDFNRTSRDLKNFVRGMNPWPCAYSYINNDVLKIHKIAIVGETVDQESGIILTANMKDGLTVSTHDGIVRLLEIQMPNGKKMQDLDYLRGHNIEVGIKLGEINE